MTLNIQFENCFKEILPLHEIKKIKTFMKRTVWTRLFWEICLQFKENLANLFHDFKLPKCIVSI